MALDAAVLRAKIEVQGAQQAQADLRNFGAQIDNVGQKSGQTSQRMRDAQGRFVSTGGAAQQATGSVKGFGGALGMINPTAIAAAAGIGSVTLAAKATVGAAIEWESALAGVAKTIDGTDAEIAALGMEIRGMATDIPIAATEIAGLAEAAGALGVAQEDILEFTRVTALIGTTTDVSADQAATSLGQLSNVLGLTADDYERFGSTLVALGNDGASTESAILGIANRSGAASELIGFATEETLAWASAIANLGIETEAGGSSLQTFFVESARFVADAGDELDTLAETAGMTASAFKTAFQQDANAALSSFITGLGELNQEAQLAVLSALGFEDVRISRALLGLAANTDNLTASLETSRTGWQENNAMAEEAEKRFETTEAKIQLMKNSVNDLGISLGNLLVPAIADTVTGLADLVTGVSNVITAMSAPPPTEIVADWDKAITELGDLPTRIPDPPEEKRSAWVEFFHTFSDMAEYDWGDLGRDLEKGLNPDLFGRFQDLELVNVTDEDIAKLKEIVATYDEFNKVPLAEQLTPDFMQDVTAQEAEMARVMLQQIELFRIYNELTADQRAGLEQNIDVIERTILTMMGMGEPVKDQREQIKFMEDNVFEYATAADNLGMSMDDLNAIFLENSDVASEFVDDVVLAISMGKVDFEDGMKAFAGVPEDVLFPALEDLETEMQEKLANALLAGEDTGPIREQLGLVRDVMDEVGYSAGGTAEQINLMNEAALNVAGAIDSAQGAMGHWEGMLSETEQAIEIVKQRIEETGDPTGEWGEKLEKLTEIQGRQAGAIHDDLEPAFVDLAIAQGEVTLTQDELNKRLEEGKISPEEYADAMTRLGEETGAAVDPQKQLVGAQQEVADTMLLFIDRMEDVLVKLGVLDDAEAEPTVTFDEQPTAEKIQFLEDNITNFPDGKEIEFTTAGVPTTTADINLLEQNVTNFPQPARLDFEAATSTARNEIGLLEGDIAGIPSSFTITAHLNDGPFMAGIHKMEGFIPHSPAKEGPLAFEPNWDWLFEGLESSASHYTEETLAHIKSYVDTANAAFGTLDSSLSFATTSAEFQASGVALPDNEFLAHLNDFVGAVTFEIGETAVKFEEQFLEATERYASAASAGMDLLGKTVEVLAGLEQDAIDLDAAKEAVTEVKIITEKLVKDLGDSAAKFASQEDEGFIGAAETYAASALAGIELLDAGIGALSGLGPNAINLSAAKEAVTEIKFITEKLVKDLGDSAVKFASTEPDGFVGAASTYAEAALPAMDLMGTALEAISTLADMGGEFSLADAKEAATEIKFVVEHLVKSIGDAAAALALNEPEDFLTGVTEFSEAAGPAIGLMGDTLDLISELTETDLEGAFARDFALLFQQLATTSRMAAEAVRRAARDWSEEVNPAVQAFSDEAGASLGLITDSLDFVTELRDADMEGAFAQDFALITQQLSTVARMAAEAVERAARDWPTEVNPAVETFTTEAGASLSLIGDAVNAVETLGSLEEGALEIDVATLAGSLSGIAYTVASAVEVASETWSNETNPQIQAFVDDAGASLGLIGDAADAVQAILEFGEEENRPNVDALAGSLVGIAETVTEAVGKAATEFETDGLEAVTRFAEAAGPALDIVSSAADIATSLNDIERITDRDMDIFLDNYEVIISAVEAVATMVETRGIEAAEDVKEAVEYIADIMNAADSAMSSAGGSGGGSSNGSSGQTGFSDPVAPLPQFASGTFTTGGGLALLHPNEFVTPEASLDRLAEKIVAGISKVGGMGSNQPIVINLNRDGRLEEQWMIDRFNNYYQRTQ